MLTGFQIYYNLRANLKIALIIIISLLPFHAVKAQNDIGTIVRLNQKSDSLLHIDTRASKNAAETALKLSLELKNDTLEYESLFSRGVANSFLGHLNEALEDFIKCKLLAKKFGSVIKTVESLNAIGNVYRDIDRYDVALQSYREALSLCNSKNVKKYTVAFNIAIVFNDLWLNDSSIFHCHKILHEIKNESVNVSDYFINGIYSTILSNYTTLKIKDSVEKYAAPVLEYYKKIGDNLSYSGNLFNIGYFYFSSQEYKKAELYLTRAKDANPPNIELVVDINKNLGHNYYKMKNYLKAAEMYQECIVLKDSLSKMQTIDKLSEMEVKYETGKKEEELKRLGAEKEVTDLKAKQSRLWLIASSVGILSVVIIAFVLFRQNKSRQQANKLLQHQNDEIVHQKKEITDSINYAKRIQLAILPPDKMVKQLLPNAFVLYKPKDVVSGDFYWMEEKNGMILFAAVDCTGHGVPGAMMSVVGLNLLNQAVKEKGLTTPSEILKHLDTGVTDTLRQSADKDSIKDGMDLSLCAYDPKTLELQYAGAFNNLWVVRKNISSSYTPQTKNEIFFEEHLLEIKADKFPIGSNVDGVADNYTNYKLKLQKGDCVYLYSDGFADQFGGPKGKKFKYNALKKFLVSVHELPPAEQREKLLSAFESWRGNLEQVDDILVIGVCV
jgi:serine phosphatase RsbU (regulator of sigma subunit)